MTTKERPAEREARGIWGMPIWGFVILITLSALVLFGSIALYFVAAGPGVPCIIGDLRTNANCFR